MRIYLAGDMRGAWRDGFFELGGIDFVDPTKKEQMVGPWTPPMYVSWDLEAIRTCDALVCYISSGNPSGIGASVEIGYALGLGIPVYSFIEQRVDPKEDRYLEFTRAASTIHFSDLKSLKRFVASLKYA